MSFVLKAIADVTVDVSIHVPGEKKPSTIQARWTLHDWDAFQDRVRQMQEGEITDEQLVGEDLQHLDGIADEKGEPLPYSSDLRDQLMQMGYVRRPLMASWFEAQNGRAKAAAKN
ncbi:hypothetical protein SAMN05661010_02517 [Modicisalibacter muralis]|uniref:Uncharacterized protein n=1 Tax=Modicisalibacter muralis TaxID=119000 RepID=A0A1G9MTV2_9GAMM|nr:hypothetical protein [Halomonas muralis]SDL77670.1 hypothetical protein SAMN05661010_02517 [Halomonas muralis]